MIKDLVSIIIPTYNRKEIVGEAINCALNQTYSDIEIIVVDNNSPDKTYEFLIQQYKASDKLKIYKNKVNLGPVKNWEKCLQYSNGEYIKILWSDDLMEASFVEKAVEIMQREKEVAFVYSKVSGAQVGATRNYGITSYSLGKTGKYRKEIFLKKTFKSDGSVPLSPGCALFRSKDIKILGEIPNNFSIDYWKTGAGPDVLIYLFATLKYKYIYYIDEVLNFFRTHSGSISCSGTDLSCSYFAAKFYFVSEVKSGRKYKEELLVSVILYYIHNGKGIGEIYKILKKYDRTMKFFCFILLYRRVICAYIKE